MMLITILLMIEDRRNISCANNACYVHISFLICDENACKTNSIIYFKFNSSKVQLKVKEVLYMGHIVSHAGLSSDPEKGKAIVAMPLLDDKRALLRFLNVVKYQGKFIQGESHITAPLPALLKEDAVWCWQPEHTADVNQLKGILSSKPALKFYDESLTRRTSRRLRAEGTCGSRITLRTAGERATGCSVRHE